MHSTVKSPKGLGTKWTEKRKGWGGQLCQYMRCLLKDLVKKKCTNNSEVPRGRGGITNPPTHPLIIHVLVCVMPFPAHLVRVPVRVKDDDGVSRLEVESQAPCPGGQQEDEVRRVLTVKQLQHLSTVISLGRSIQSKVAIP